GLSSINAAASRRKDAASASVDHGGLLLSSRKRARVLRACFFWPSWNWDMARKASVVGSFWSPLSSVARALAYAVGWNLPRRYWATPRGRRKVGWSGASRHAVFIWATANSHVKTLACGCRTTGQAAARYFWGSVSSRKRSTTSRACWRTAALRVACFFRTARTSVLDRGREKRASTRPTASTSVCTAGVRGRAAHPFPL